MGEIKFYVGCILLVVMGWFATDWLEIDFLKDRPDWCSDASIKEICWGESRNGGDYLNTCFSANEFWDLEIEGHITEEEYSRLTTALSYAHIGECW